MIRRRFAWPEPEPAEGQRFARLHGIHEDARARLWVQLSSRPRIEQEREVRRGGEMRTVTRVVTDSDAERAESIIEVFDSATGESIAHARFEGVFGFATTHGRYQLVYTTFGVGAAAAGDLGLQASIDWGRLPSRRTARGSSKPCPVDAAGATHRGRPRASCVAGPRPPHYYPAERAADRTCQCAGRQPRTEPVR